MPSRSKGPLKRTVVTSHDVARAARVSQAAVSRAFTSGASIAPATRKKILAAAETLGYRPNLIARSLTSGRSNIVGIGVGHLRNPFFAESLEMLSTALQTAGYRSLLLPNKDRAVVETDIGEVLHYRLDALILISTTLTTKLAVQCRNAQVPVILYNRISTDRSISSVTINNRVGAATIAAFLHAGGHERPAIISGLVESSTSQDREQGFMKFFADAGLAAPRIERGNFEYTEAMAAARRLMARPDRPDAIFCANDWMAMAAINVARFEFGLLPGRDISIVGFDDAPPSAWPAFSLTTFAQPIKKMVDSVIETIEQLRKDPRSSYHLVLEGQLTIRASARIPDTVHTLPK